jgi:hypothetical protein
VTPEELAAARARRWWQTRRPIRSLARAGAFVEDVGFALLFPARGLSLPCLFTASADTPAESISTLEWEPDGARVWRWKDELPLNGLAWSGKFLRGRSTFLSPAMLAVLYPRSGTPDDFVEEEGLSPDARRIAEMVLLSGPTPTAFLREALGLDAKGGRPRFAQAVTELGRALVVTNYGTEDLGGAWPSSVLELTARAFPLERPGHPDQAVRRFVHTMIDATPAELAGAFGWPRKRAAEALQAARGA